MSLKCDEQSSKQVDFFKIEHGVEERSRSDNQMNKMKCLMKINKGLGDVERKENIESTL